MAEDAGGRNAFDVSWVTLWRVLAFVTLAIILYQGRQILLGLFLAIVIASGIEGIVDVLEARVRLPRSVSVILIFLVILVGLVVVVYTVVPFLLVEINTIFAGSGKSIAGDWGALFGLQSPESITSLIGSISSRFLNTNASPIDLFSSALGSFGLAAAVVVSSFYLSLTHDGVERFLQVVVPQDYEETTMRIYRRSKQLIGSWFRMQILLSVTMGFIVWAGLALIGVRYAFLIAVLAAIFELVPFLGPIFSGAIAVVSALLTSTALAIYTLIFFIIAQQFESHILVPLLTRRAIGMHPVIVIVALLIGAEIGGLLGVIIAVPLAAILQEMVRDWSSRRRRERTAV